LIAEDVSIVLAGREVNRGGPEPRAQRRPIPTRLLEPALEGANQVLLIPLAEGEAVKHQSLQ
jgi:hypothetical protein